MAKKSELSLSRRDFLKTAGAISLLAAAGGSVPLTLFEAGCTKGGSPSGPQILRANLAGEPNNLDCNITSWSTSITTLLQIYQGLFGYDKNLALIPLVAKEIPTVANKGISADGKTYTFNLRNDVTWSDGKKVTAKDFEFSIKRMLDPDLAGEYSSIYYSIVGAEAYNNAAKETAAKKTELKAALGVKATGDYTLQVTLKAAQPTFPQMMGLWPVFPVREDIILAKPDKWQEAGNLIGNGPYTLAEWVHQDHITLKRNENYWGTKPALTEIDYKIITDANAALAAYDAGELDLTAVPVGTEKATMADPARSKQIVRQSSLSIYAIQFNVNKAPFNNLKVRQAFSCAVDRAAFVDKVRAGVGKVATSWVPPGLPGADATLGKENEFNVATAKQRLADAGFSDVSKLGKITLNMADTASNKTIAQFIQGQLKDNLGIDIELGMMESKAYQNYVNSELHQMAWFGWLADYPDIENFLEPNFRTKAGNNHTGYANPAFDDLATKALSELDNAKRIQLWEQAHKMIITDCPVVCLFNREFFYLVKPYVKNLTPTAMDGSILGDHNWTSVSIQK
jgi:oligopeptide transport system substrate-binding protein